MEVTKRIGSIAEAVGIGTLRAFHADDGDDAVSPRQPLIHAHGLLIVAAERKEIGDILLIADAVDEHTEHHRHHGKDRKHQSAVRMECVIKYEYESFHFVLISLTDFISVSWGLIPTVGSPGTVSL